MKYDIPRICVTDTANIREVLRTINGGVLGVAFLVDPVSGRFRGLVSDGDIRRALLNGLGLASPASKIERPKTVVATTDMSMDEIAEMFSEEVRIVPILDADHKVSDIATFDNRTYFPVAGPKFGEMELRYVNECVLTGWVSFAGKFVRIFEKQFSEYCGTKFAVSCSSGTSALHLSLLAAGIGSGDEVIVPSLTFIATANAVSFTGATPVFVDSELDTWNIDPDHVEQAITEKTKGIIPVHLYGHPADMDPILRIAEKYDLLVIEDAAEAHGATYKGRKVGSIGHLGIFSFYGNKIITTGEGGMVVTDNTEFAEKIRILRNHGMDSKCRYRHEMLGYNYRLTNIQAALGVGQMERIEAILAKKRLIAETYTENLKYIRGISLPHEASWAENVFWLYTILIDERFFGLSRDKLMAELEKNRIETRRVFPPVHSQPIYQSDMRLPNAKFISSQGLSLPSSVNLEIDDIVKICNVIKFIKGKQ